jgi:hypothetical protein
MTAGGDMQTSLSAGENEILDAYSKAVIGAAEKIKAAVVSIVPGTDINSSGGVSI